MNGEALIDGMLIDVERFCRDVLYDPPPDRPSKLVGDKREHALDLLQEEVREFEEADNLEEQADALVDVAYTALGQLVRMGVAPGAAFAAVHEANMRKERGSRDKHPHSGGVDAVKSEGWDPPKLSCLLKARAEDVAAVRDLSPLFFAALAKREERGAEYNKGGVKLEDYFPYDDSYPQMVWVKSLRLRSIVKGQKDGEISMLDAARDSLVDLVNYASFWYESLLREEGLFFDSETHTMQDGNLPQIRRSS